MANRTTIVDWLTALITAVVPIVAVLIQNAGAINIWARGPYPEKHLNVTSIGAVDLLRPFSFPDGDLKASLKIQGKTLKNLYQLTVVLQNTGKSPIVPSDFIEPLTLSVPKPWTVVAVENGPLASIKLRWARAGRRSFKADDDLLNPGDSAEALVYVTTSSSGQNLEEEVKQLKVTTTLHVIGLREMTPVDPLQRINSVAPSGLLVFLSGYSVWFTLLTGFLIQFVYLYLAKAAFLLQGWSWRSIIVTAASGVFSLCVAESLATMLFGNIFTMIFGVDYVANGLPLVGHTLILGFLLYKRHRVNSLVTSGDVA